MNAYGNEVNWSQPVDASNQHRSESSSSDIIFKLNSYSLTNLTNLSSVSSLQLPSTSLNSTCHSPRRIFNAASEYSTIYDDPFVHIPQRLSRLVPFSDYTPLLSPEELALCLSVFTMNGSLLSTACLVTELLSRDILGFFRTVAQEIHQPQLHSSFSSAVFRPEATNSSVSKTPSSTFGAFLTIGESILSVTAAYNSGSHYVLDRLALSNTTGSLSQNSKIRIPGDCIKHPSVEGTFLFDLSEVLIPSFHSTLSACLSTLLHPPSSSIAGGRVSVNNTILEMLTQEEELAFLKITCHLTANHRLVDAIAMDVSWLLALKNVSKPSKLWLLSSWIQIQDNLNRFASVAFKHQALSICQFEIQYLSQATQRVVTDELRNPTKRGIMLELVASIVDREPFRKSTCLAAFAAQVLHLHPNDRLSPSDLLRQVHIMLRLGMDEETLTDWVVSIERTPFHRGAGTVPLWLDVLESVVFYEHHRCSAKSIKNRGTNGRGTSVRLVSACGVRLTALVEDMLPGDIMRVIHLLRQYSSVAEGPPRHRTLVDHCRRIVLSFGGLLSQNDMILLTEIDSRFGHVAMTKCHVAMTSATVAQQPQKPPRSENFSELSSSLTRTWESPTVEKPYLRSASLLSSRLHLRLGNEDDCRISDILRPEVVTSVTSQALSQQHVSEKAEMACEQNVALVELTAEIKSLKHKVEQLLLALDKTPSSHITDVEASECVLHEPSMRIQTDAIDGVVACGSRPGGPTEVVSSTGSHGTAQSLAAPPIDVVSAVTPPAHQLPHVSGLLSLFWSRKRYCYVAASELMSGLPPSVSRPSSNHRMHEMPAEFKPASFLTRLIEAGAILLRSCQKECNSLSDLRLCFVNTLPFLGSPTLDRLLTACLEPKSTGVVSLREAFQNIGGRVRCVLADSAMFNGSYVESQSVGDSYQREYVHSECYDAEYDDGIYDVFDFDQFRKMERQKDLYYRTVFPNPCLSVRR
eukprot:GHVQ01015776.1.p1 GENE.GHVQ01015776.1~~GHVQ01015776.1.p1  ORF type:complete len:1083 (+),score=122.17 GHVQ01015776.1:326-3250(+)